MLYVLFFGMFGILLNGISIFYRVFQKGDITSVPANLSHESFYGKPMKGLGGQCIKHRIVLVRHGESQHNVNYENGHQDMQVDSPLTRIGHTQAKNVAKYLSNIGFLPNNICMSPMTRTCETAEPTLKLFGNEISSGTISLEISPKYMEVNTWKDCDVGQEQNIHKSYKETFTDFANRIRELVDHVEVWSNNLEKPTQSLIFTHSMVISEILNHIVNKERAEIDDEKWSKIYWQVANGSLTCIDYTENNEGRVEWHIQAVNFTKHISIHSGVKSPFI